MTETIQFVARHGYLLIFFWLFAEQGALPVPSFPLLLISGALVRTGNLNLRWLLLSGFSACIIADAVWFHLGRRYGPRALQFICRISIEPDSCVRRTENAFLDYGLTFLLLSKFIPGLNAVAAPLSGGSSASFWQFVVFDSAGTLLWLGVYIAAGYAFSDELEIAISYAARLGRNIFAVALLALSAWIAWKVIQRIRFLKSLNIERISPAELLDLLNTGCDVTIVDVRGSLAPELMFIPEALRIPTEELAARHEEIPRDREIVLFCS